MPLLYSSILFSSQPKSLLSVPVSASRLFPFHPYFCLLPVSTHLVFTQSPIRSAYSHSHLSPPSPKAVSLIFRSYSPQSRPHTSVTSRYTQSPFVKSNFSWPLHHHHHPLYKTRTEIIQFMTQLSDIRREIKFTSSARIKTFLHQLQSRLCKKWVNNIKATHTFHEIRYDELFLKWLNVESWRLK